MSLRLQPDPSETYIVMVCGGDASNTGGMRASAIRIYLLPRLEGPALPLCGAFLSDPASGRLLKRRDIVDPMCRGIVFALVALIGVGCAKPPPSNSVSQAAFFRGPDYHTWTCRDLVDEANLLTDALAVATEQQPSAEANTRIAHIERSRESVHREMARKNCKT